VDSHSRDSDGGAQSTDVLPKLRTHGLVIEMRRYWAHETRASRVGSYENRTNATRRVAAGSPFSLDGWRWRHALMDGGPWPSGVFWRLDEPNLRSESRGGPGGNVKGNEEPTLVQSDHSLA
jgi:hypothetical protein